MGNILNDVEAFMKKITNGVFLLESTRGSYAYVWVSEGASLLIDTSLPGKSAAMISELDSGGWHPTHILITHYDVDHIGNMARISEHFEATVLIPRQDVPYVTGEKSRPGVKRIIGALMKVSLPTTWAAIDANASVGGLTALASPGHTPGHLAYGADTVLFVGDAFRTRSGQPIPSPRILVWDSHLEAKSRTQLLNDFSGWICPAHGEPILWPRS